MGCLFRPSINTIWSLWYCVGTLLLNVYLIYLGIERYRLYTEMKWPTGGYPPLHLTAYVALHALAIGCLPFFIAFAAFKVGNLAGDNERLGARTDRTMRVGGSKEAAGDCCSRLAKGVWTHFPPMSHSVHLLMAFAMLLAQQLMLAQLYKQRIMVYADVFSTEMDFVFQNGKQLAKNLPLNATLKGFHSNDKFQLTRQPIGPKLLPILMNQTLFGIPLELCNFVAALLCFSVSYAAVFQRASACFALIFSGHLIIYSVEALFSYFAFSILYRMHVAGFTKNIAVIGTDGRSPFLLRDEAFVLVAYLSCAIVLYLASAAVYGYGYNKFQISWLSLRTRSPVTIGESAADATHNVDGSPAKYKSNIMTTSVGGGAAASTVCCEGYIPHVCAIALLVPMVILKAPVLYDLMVLYPESKPPVVISCIIVDLVYLFSWILLWLALTCKRKWDFKVSYSVPEIVALLQADRPPSGKRITEDARKLHDLKNALLLLSGDEVMIVVDQVARNSIFRHAQKYGFESNAVGQDVYWLKTAGGGGGPVAVTSMNQMASSPATNRRFVSDKSPSEVQRPLLGTVQQRRPSDETPDPRVVQHYAAYQTIGSPRHHPQPAPRAAVMGGSFNRAGGYAIEQQLAQHPDQNVTSFGTLPRGDYKRHQQQRVMQGSAASDLQYNGRPPLPPQQQRMFQYHPAVGVAGPSSMDNFYASIHKQQRAPSSSGSLQQQQEAAYTRYAQPPPHLQQQQADNASLASRGSSYVNVNQSAPSHYYQPPMAIRQPPQTRVMHQTTPSDSGSMQRIGGQPGYAYTGPTAVRDSPVLEPRGVRQPQQQQADYYQRVGNPSSAVKLSSFGTDGRNAGGDTVGRPSILANGGSREVTPMSQASSTLTRADVQQQQQAQHIQWHGNPMYGRDTDAASSTNDGNYTPSSTLTSQGSYPINTPTAGSPQHDNYDTLTAPASRGGRNKTVYPANGGVRMVADGQPPLPPGHERNDSANFSLTSSNDSGQPRHTATTDDTATAQQFSTSVV